MWGNDVENFFLLWYDIMYFLYIIEIYIGRLMKLKGKINKNVYFLLRVVMLIKEFIVYMNIYFLCLVIKFREE